MTVEGAGTEGPTGLTDLMGSIHRDPNLREWVTPGSVCLVPVASAAELGWTVHGLLAEQDDEGLHPPSALVSWSWPAGEVVERRHLNPSEVPGPLPLDVVTPPSDYLVALEDLLAGPPSPSGNDAARDLAQQMLRGELRRAYMAVAGPTVDPLGDYAETPKPLVVYLDAWIGDAMGLANQHGAQQTNRSLQALRSRRVQPGFRVAFVGSFTSGKSRVVNQLLGRDLLPTGPGAVLHHAVSVVGASTGEERLETTAVGGRVVARPLDPRSWADLLDDGSAAGTRRVKAHVHNQWLRTNDIELVDTPGYCMSSPSQAALIERALSSADAVVVCLDASEQGDVPLSRSDVMFIEDVKAAPHEPPIAVVLVTTEGDHHPRQVVADHDLSTVRETLAAAGLGATGVGVGILPDLDLDLVGPPRTTVLRGPNALVVADEPQEEVEDLRELIERWALSGERRRQRDLAIANQLIGEIGGLQSFAGSGLDAARLKEQARQDRRAALDDQIWAAVPVWKEMEQLLADRRQELMAAVGAHLADAGATATQRIFVELDASEVPRSYWAEDLPGAIRRELVGAVEAVALTVRSGLDADLKGFDDELRRQFKARGVLGPGVVTTAPDGQERADLTLAVDAWPEPGPQSNGSAALVRSHRAALAELAESPLAMLLRGALTGAAGRLALSSEAFIGDELLTAPLPASEQSRVRPHLEVLVGEAVDALARAADDEVRRFHGQLLFQAKRCHQRWLAHQRRALDQAGMNGTEAWHRLADACDHLSARISRSVADEESRAMHSRSLW